LHDGAVRRNEENIFNEDCLFYQCYSAEENEEKIFGAGSCLYGEREGQGTNAVFQKLKKFIERRRK
jgi:hypothetical protein